MDCIIAPEISKLLTTNAHIAWDHSIINFIQNSTIFEKISLTLKISPNPYVVALLRQINLAHTLIPSSHINRAYALDFLTLVFPLKPIPTLLISRKICPYSMPYPSSNTLQSRHQLPLFHLSQPLNPSLLSLIPSPMSNPPISILVSSLYPIPTSAQHQHPYIQPQAN